MNGPPPFQADWRQMTPEMEQQVRELNQILQRDAIKALEQSKAMLIEAGADDEIIQKVDDLLDDTIEGKYHGNNIWPEVNFD